VGSSQKALWWLCIQPPGFDSSLFWPFPSLLFHDGGSPAGSLFPQGNGFFHRRWSSTALPTRRRGPSSAFSRRPKPATPPPSAGAPDPSCVRSSRKQREFGGYEHVATNCWACAEGPKPTPRDAGGVFCALFLRGSKGYLVGRKARLRCGGRFSTRVFFPLGAALRFGVASSTGSIFSVCTGVTGKEGPHSGFFRWKLTEERRPKTRVWASPLTHFQLEDSTHQSDLYILSRPQVSIVGAFPVKHSLTCEGVR